MRLHLPCTEQCASSVSIEETSPLDVCKHPVFVKRRIIGRDVSNQVVLRIGISFRWAPGYQEARAPFRVYFEEAQETGIRFFR